MTDEPARVVFHLDPNAALVGVLRSVVQFRASNAGFEAEPCADIAGACEDVCREIVSKCTDADSGLDVTLDTFADRIEVSILHRGQLGRAIGNRISPVGNTPAEGAGGIDGLELRSRVDRVLHNTEDGKVRTTLVKFLKPKS
jgi:hypothetical protein